MTKIKVKPEGRINTYVVTDKESLKKYIRSLKFKNIHNFIQSGAFIGCDYTKTATFKVIDKATKIGIFTDRTQNIGHSLACITDRLEMFDIGEINENNLEIEQ